MSKKVMKTILALAGVAVIGTVGLQAAEALPVLTPAEAAKPYSVSLSVRGFYDDNIATRSSPLRQDAWGTEISPSAKLRLRSDVTEVSAAYRYALRYYDGRKPHSADHMHIFDAALNHAFSERYRFTLTDNFAAAQEAPIINAPGTLAAVPLRINGNNLRNVVDANFDAFLTEKFGVGLGYRNTWYDYEEKGAFATLGRSSYSALLDRLEHLGTINLKYKVSEPTIALLGYQFGAIHFTSGDVLLPAPINAMPNSRDSYSHYYFVGLDHTFNPYLSANFRGGAQTVDYHRLPGAKLRTNPYFDVALKWRYLEGSSALIGVKHARNQTDVVAPDATGSYTLDSESTMVYAAINHAFIQEKFLGSVQISYQNSEFRGGIANKQNENFVVLGLNLTYNINKYLAAELGYNFDLLSSDLDPLVGYRSYHRNVGYVGLRATY